MTVDDEAAAVEEADRLGEQLLPGYRPSEIFNAPSLQVTKRHFDQGHNPETCDEARFWTQVTGNRALAVLLTTERERVDLDELLDTQVGTLGKKYPGTVVSMISDGRLVSLEEKELTSFEAAFATWAGMRTPEIGREISADYTGDQIAQCYLWEGFLAGIMFAQTVGELRGHQ